MSLRARTDALIAAVDIRRTTTIKGDVRALAAALGVPFNGVATTLAALEAECLAAPAPAPAPAQVTDGAPSVGVAASILNKTVLPDSLTATQRTQVKAALADELIASTVVSLAALLEDDTPGHAQLRWAALREAAKHADVIADVDAATQDAARACAAAARDGDADAMSCVRELAKIGGPIANFIVFTSVEAVSNGDEEGALAVIADAADASNEDSLRISLGACAELLAPGGGEVADRRRAVLRVVPALAARAPIPDKNQESLMLAWRAVADACTRHATAAVGAPERGVAPADALQCWAAAFDHFLESGGEPPTAAVERALVERADDDAPLLRRRALAVLELFVDVWDRYGLNPESREQWRRWLTAASAAEYESGHHLVAAAADAFFDIRTTPMLEAKWLHALARRLLRHRNPAARKAFLQRLLDHAAPAEVADWPLVRDAVLPALDDNELRKSRDVARRCDAAAVDFVARFYRAAPAETRAAVVAYALRGGGRPRARAALLGPFEDLEFASLPGPRIQDDDVAAAAAALEAAGNDAATHALAVAVVPLVCCQEAAAAPATAGRFAAACTRAVADEEALDERLATWLASRVSDAGAIDDARAAAAVAAVTMRPSDVDSVFKRHGLKGLRWLVTDARGNQRRSIGVWDAAVAIDVPQKWLIGALVST